jgi:hypothetical protein
MIMLPQIVNSIVEASVSVERIREFLLCEEYSIVGEGSLKEKGEVWMNGTFVYGTISVIETTIVPTRFHSRY